MLGAQNSLGPVCPVPLTVRGTRIRLPARIKLYYRSRGCLPVRCNCRAKYAPYERLAQLHPLIVDPAPCDGEARLRKLIVCQRNQARLRDCGMGNSLDCGLGDCGSPDDAESDYSKPVEYSQVLSPASNAKGTVSTRPASHL